MKKVCSVVCKRKNNFHTDAFDIPKILKLKEMKEFTPKIRLEPFNLSHSNDIFQILVNEPTIWKYYPIKQPTEWVDFEEQFVTSVSNI